MKINEQWHKCNGCRQLKTINFKPKEKEKQITCECGKVNNVKNKVLKNISGAVMYSALLVETYLT